MRFSPSNCWDLIRSFWILYVKTMIHLFYVRFFKSLYRMSVNEVAPPPHTIMGDLLYISVSDFLK